MIKKLQKDSDEITEFIKKDTKKHQLKGTRHYIRPVEGWISSKFGFRIHPIFKRRAFHGGIDFAAPYGRKILAADSGVVKFSGNWGGYGNITIIDHGDG